MKPSRHQKKILDWVKNGEGHLVCNAFAGSGKSSSLKMIVLELEKLGYTPNDIRICVFGKANSLDLVEKFGEKWKQSISTLHSIGWSVLKQHLSIKKPSDYKIDTKKYDKIAEGLGLEFEDKDSEEYLGKKADFLKIVDLVRLTNKESTPNNISDICQHFEISEIQDYEMVSIAVEKCLKLGKKSALSNNKIFDFTDQIWLPVTWQLWKQDYSIVALDECQDMNAAQLELAISLVGDKGRLIFVGDRCQPPDTKVLIVNKRGDRWSPAITEEVSIQDVKLGDPVYAFSQKENSFYTSKISAITKRHYCGDLVVAELEDRISKYTPNHHCIASFALYRKHYTVYLMQKGNQFRVGMSRVDQAQNQATGPVMRLRQEKGDCLWILGFYLTKEEAYIAEQSIAGRFGLPQLIFTNSSGNIKTPDLLEKAWKFIGNNTERAVSCLQFFNKDIRYPLFTSGQDWKQSLKRPMVVNAINLVEGCLVLPYNGNVEENPSSWKPIKISREFYSGDVYSLEIEKYHNYVADGILTHNCQSIFGFSGADCNSIETIIKRTNATELPLSTCYRCPKSHIKLVRDIFPNILIEAYSKNKEGSIKSISDRQLEDKDFLVTGDLLLSRRTSPLVKLCIKLISKGVSATVKGRAIGELLKSELREVVKIKPFEYKDFRNATDRYRSKKLEKWKYKENLDQLLESFEDRLAALIAIYESQINARSIKDLEDYIDTLFSDSISPVTLSTVHRAKGLEAERVFIIEPESLPLSWKNQNEWQLKQEYNLLYVALTRSKSDLFIVGQPRWMKKKESGREIIINISQ